MVTRVHISQDDLAAVLQDLVDEGIVAAGTLVGGSYAPPPPTPRRVDNFDRDTTTAGVIGTPTRADLAYSNSPNGSNPAVHNHCDGSHLVCDIAYVGISNCANLSQMLPHGERDQHIRVRMFMQQDAAHYAIVGLRCDGSDGGVAVLFQSNNNHVEALPWVSVSNNNLNNSVDVGDAHTALFNGPVVVDLSLSGTVLTTTITSEASPSTPFTSTVDVGSIVTATGGGTYASIGITPGSSNAWIDWWDFVYPQAVYDTFDHYTNGEMLGSGAVTHTGQQWTAENGGMLVGSGTVKDNSGANGVFSYIDAGPGADQGGLAAVLSTDQAGSSDDVLLIKMQPGNDSYGLALMQDGFYYVHLNGSGDTYNAIGPRIATGDYGHALDEIEVYITGTTVQARRNNVVTVPPFDYVAALTGIGQASAATAIQSSTVYGIGGHGGGNVAVTGLYSTFGVTFNGAVPDPTPA